MQTQTSSGEKHDPGLAIGLLLSGGVSVTVGRDEWDTDDPGFGLVLFVFGIVTWLRARKSANPDTRFRFNAVMAMMLVQVVLGIVTVLYVAQMHIAITHQIGAVVLWVLIIRARFGAQYPKAQSIRGTAA